jgi:hypothetical protein
MVLVRFILIIEGFIVLSLAVVQNSKIYQQAERDMLKIPLERMKPNPSRANGVLKTFALSHTYTSFEGEITIGTPPQKLR